MHHGHPSCIYYIILYYTDTIYNNVTESNVDNIRLISTLSDWGVRILCTKYPLVIVHVYTTAYMIYYICRFLHISLYIFYFRRIRRPYPDERTLTHRVSHFINNAQFVYKKIIIGRLVKIAFPPNNYPKYNSTGNVFFFS